MADVKITDMTDDGGGVTGVEKIPVSDGGSPKQMDVNDIKDFVVDQIEAISAGSSVDGDTSVYILDGGALKPVDIDKVAQHAIDTIWGKAAEASPDSADVMALKDGGSTEKTVTLSVLAEYVRATIEASILDVSDLSAHTSLIDADKFLVTSGTTGKYVTYAIISAAIYASLKDHVTGLGSVSSLNAADEFYVVQSGVAKKCLMSDIATYFGSPLTGSGTSGVLAQWGAANALTDGPVIIESGTGFTTGSDGAVGTTAAVAHRIQNVVFDSTDIGADIADADAIVVADGNIDLKQRKATFTRVWTWIVGKIQALTAKTSPVDGDILTIQDSADSNALKEVTIGNLWDNRFLADLKAIADLTGHGWFIDEDSMATDSAVRVPSQQSVKAYVDAKVVSSVDYLGGYDASTNTPDLDTSPSGVLKGDMYTVTVAGTFFTTGVEIGDVLIAEADSATTESEWTIVNKNLDAASIKVAYESNADTNEFSDAEQTKLSGIEALADVTDATNVDAAGAVMESDFNAQTVLISVVDDTPGPLTVGEDTVVGRITGGNIGTLTRGQVYRVMNKVANITSGPQSCSEGYDYTNAGASGSIVFNLPSASSDARIRFRVKAAYDMVITAAAGDYIRDADVVSAAAGTCTISDIGTVVELEASDSDTWNVVAASGELDIV